MRKRLEALESRHPREPEPSRIEGEKPAEAPHIFWLWEMESIAGALLFGWEPESTVEESRVLYALGSGRFVADSRRGDIREFLGHGMEERMNATSSLRWRRFLDSDERARELLELILEKGQVAETPPEDFRLTVGIYVPDGGTPDPEQEEQLRRLTWVLAHDSEALVMLSELTKRRDEFARGFIYS